MQSIAWREGVPVADVGLAAEAAAHVASRVRSPVGQQPLPRAGAGSGGAVFQVIFLGRVYGKNHKVKKKTYATNDHPKIIPLFILAT